MIQTKNTKIMKTTEISTSYQVQKETEKGIELTFELEGKKITAFFPKNCVELNGSLKVKTSFWNHKREELAPKELFGNLYNFWSPEENFCRFYFDDRSYLQLSTKDRSPQGYYERHRACKGENVTTTFIKATKGIAQEVAKQLNEQTDWYEVAKDFYFALPSGQNKVVFCK